MNLRFEWVLSLTCFPGPRNSPHYGGSNLQWCTSRVILRGGIVVYRAICRHVGSSRRGMLWKNSLTSNWSIMRDPMIHTYFSEKDIHQIVTRGQTPETVLSQIETFKRGIP